MRDTQIGSQSYMEKRRGCREIQGIRRRRGGVKRGERNLANNQFRMRSPQAETPREIHIEKRRRRKEIEMTRRSRGVVKRGETDLASNQIP